MVLSSCGFPTYLCCYVCFSCCEIEEKLEVGTMKISQRMSHICPPRTDLVEEQLRCFYFNLRNLVLCGAETCGAVVFMYDSVSWQQFDGAVGGTVMTNLRVGELVVVSAGLHSQYTVDSNLAKVQLHHSFLSKTCFLYSALTSDLSHIWCNECLFHSFRIVRRFTHQYPSCIELLYRFVCVSVSVSHSISPTDQRPTV